MDYERFHASLVAERPPAGLTPALQALWYDAQDDWAAAHRLAQADDSRAGAWVHAYLHRKEGDSANAAYWYARAQRAPGTRPPDEEWRDLVQALLAAT
ncbi:hypothetical protein HUS23_09240 [Ectothiorhodospiraceae bacterium 2226]|nr:hypothetical protein HUS23_09240 [Ectothiorhodospiraceae bacterium 2226]